MDMKIKFGRFLQLQTSSVIGLHTDGDSPAMRIEVF
jgi:hypothetical protein